MTDKILASKSCLALDGAGRRRNAVTLVELLVVMAVVVLLAGLVLPSVRTLLKDQRTSQSARVVQGFIESARARAIASNRPVAVILERLGDLDSDSVGLHTCTQLSLGEVFPPYEGDWAGATGTLMDATGDGYADSFDIPMAQAATLSSIASVGDLIEFGMHKVTFRITAITTAGTNVRVSFLNPPQYTSGKGKLVYSSEQRLPTKGGATENLRFRIYRKPTKTLAGSVVLPRGTCIDLAWSGLGTTGLDFRTSTNQIASQNSTIAAKRSVFIVFNGSGSVDLVYEFQQNTGGSAIVPAPTVLGLIHLLIGRTDQIDLAASSTGVPDREDVKANVADTANNWVSINGFSGRVYSSDIAPPDSSNSTDAAVAATARYFATVGVNKKGI